MPIEIERKFLVDHKKWEALPKPDGELYTQGYINTDPSSAVRVRATPHKGFLTIKGKTSGFSRSEYEYEIPLKDAHELIEHFTSCSVQKKRYKINLRNKNWEIDEFQKENQGLITAELELKSKNEKIEIPDWISEEVTNDNRYSNLNLAQNPYQNWKPDEVVIENLKIPGAVIKEIAELLETGMVPFVHKKTFELISIPDSYRFLEMDWEDEESDWADDIKRVESDPDFQRIESMESHESFQIMEGFVFSLPESRVKVQLETAIYGSKPFSNFNRLIHQAGKEKEQWFKFRLERMKAWVIRQLENEYPDPEIEDAEEEDD